jgi:hypothetical protein
MMGTHQPQASLFAYRVDLEQRVRPDHPLRRVATVVDFGFVREQVAPCYGYNGHVSVGTVVADSKYGTVENYRHCQRLGITTHMADLQTKQAGTGRRAAIFADTDFVYAAATDTYRCPGGQTLRRHHWNAARRVWQYRTPAGACAVCALRAQCTRAKDGRSLQRHEDHELVQQARVQANSVAARRDRRRRRHLMEGSFADAENNHGFKRARWRRLWRQEIQDWLIAAIQNVRILLAHPLRPVHTAAQAAQAPVALPSASRGGWRIGEWCWRAFEITLAPRERLNRFHPCP